MERLKKVVKVIPHGQFPDSRGESRRYWRSRPPAERVEAGRELRRDTYRHITGRDLPRMIKAVRVLKRRNP